MVIALAFPGALIGDYLAWKYIIGFVNHTLGID